MQPEHVRDVTDRLDEFSEFSGLPFHTVDIAVPEVLVGGLIGSMIIFYFTGLSISAVGRTAHEVVLEVRRQFEEKSARPLLGAEVLASYLMFGTVTGILMALFLD